ncbi:MAG: low temperature requirement protein A [Saprospiraceae bacterium]|nr:low temperature requirement protein A [Saprospiraceae bacterium]
MRSGINSPAWWGAPKKFETRQKDRRVSWLELFFDLVYVIAISRITHHLTGDMSAAGFLEYICLFMLVYWGWLNSSLHHDLHGNSGLRTRLMTLWQMMIVAALAVVTNKYPDDHHHSITVVFMIMQLFITYQWWSVGLYDKNHRRYSWPYTTLYLVSFGLMGLSMLLSSAWLAFIVPLILICNYGPPFISHILLTRSSNELDLSSSMFERLGLFTIIIFGELVLGVVNGITEVEVLDITVWLNFAFAISLVFALWWIFFTMIARRHAKKNFIRASLLELLYIPTLISLGLLAAGFPSFFGEASGSSLQDLFCYGIAIFLICVSLLTGLLEYPEVFDKIKNPMRFSIFFTGVVFAVFPLFDFDLSQPGFLLSAIAILSAEILYLNFVYFRKLSKEGLEHPDDQT